MVRTRVGYAGGTSFAPTYHRLGGHAETIEVDYDPRVITYQDLLAVFFASHMPTHPPFSTQYRSAIFYRSEAERDAAEQAIARTEATVGRVHVAVEPYSAFHSAEAYHQKFYWKQFAREWRGEPAGRVPNSRSREFCEWASKRGISSCAAGKNAGKESAVAG